MKLEICKFGGTSVSNDMRCQYACDIVKEKAKKNKVIVVISAMGRLGDPYATDTLANLGNQYLSDQEMARLLSMGELVSSIRFCGKLRAMGLNAYALSFRENGILSDDNYQCANVLSLDNTEVSKLLEAYDILVSCGFVAMNNLGEITTLGRGGSDFTAVLMAKMMNLSEVEIYTDVDGVYDSDPKVNLHAKRYKEITYHQMLAMHSKVLHDRCVDYAAKNHIQIYLKSTFTNDAGTLVRENGFGVY